MKNYLLLLSFFMTTCIFAQETSNNDFSAVENYLEHLIDRQGIPGLAFAVVKNGEVVYRQNFGFANIEHQVPVTNASIFRLYSLSKPTVAVGVFQLLEAGKLSLDDQLSDYFSDLPTTWNEITIAHLLSHSSGLPDMSPLPAFSELSEEEAKAKVFEQEVSFTPGAKYDYNQTGFWLLQRIVEQVSGENLATFILNGQFQAAEHTFFSSDSRDIVLNRATPYFFFAKGSLMIDHSYLQGDYAHAKNGLNISLDDYLKWDQRLNNNQLLTATTQHQMWTPFPYTQSEQVFTYGWDQHMLNGHVSYGFTGSLCTAYRNFPEDKLSIFFLSNGLSKWYNLDNAIDHLASLINVDIINTGNYPFEPLLQASVEESEADFAKTFARLRSDPRLAENNFEAHLNDVGYFLLRALGESEKAIEVFTFNTRMFPTSPNTFDSLAEAYEQNGNREQSILNYEKAISLSTDSWYVNSTKVKLNQLRKE